MAEDNLKNLPPEERIKRLKQLEEQKKKEIDQARELIKQSEKEMNEQEEWKRRIPIPQIALEGSSDLSEAEKEIIKAHKGLKTGKKEVSETVQKEISLEETVEREKIQLPPDLIASEYAIKLSRQPMDILSQEMKNIYQAVEDKGYVSPEEERRIGYISAATERKLEDMETGKYSLTESVAEAAALTKRLGTRLMYRR